MTNGLIFAILGLCVGALVTKAIENKNNNKKYLFIFLSICVVAVMVWIRFNLK